MIHGPNIPGSYAILFFTASDLASITSHSHNWVLFLLWLHPFILSGVISPLISSNILGTYRRGEFIFQCPIFLPFHTVHGVLKVRILKWFAIPFSSGPHSVRSLHHDHGHQQMVNTKIRMIIFFAAKDGEALYSQQKQDRELTVAQIMNSLLPNSDLN